MVEHNLELANKRVRAEQIVHLQASPSPVYLELKVVEEVEITPVLNHLEILADLVVEQTIVAILLQSRDWQHKGPKIHHLVEHLDLISMETTED